MAGGDLDKVLDVEIDAGIFKYVYIRVYEDAGGDGRWKKNCRINTEWAV